MTYLKKNEEIIKNNSINRYDQVEFFIIKLQIKINSDLLMKTSNYFPKDNKKKFSKYILMLFGGKRQFTVYLSNAGNHLSNDINIILSTDVENIENERVLRGLENETLSIYGFNSGDYFTITNIVTVPKLVGSNTNRFVKAEVKFFYNIDISANGFPEKLCNHICILPNSQTEKEIIKQRIIHWDEYLKISERIAKETEAILEYSNHKTTKNIGQLVFTLKKGVITSKHYKSSIQLIISEEFEDGQIYYKGPIIGKVHRYDSNDKTLTIDLDSDFQDMCKNDKYRIPSSARLFITKIGDIVQIRRLRNGLKTFSRGQAVNPFLDIFLFNSLKARGLVVPRSKLSTNVLLQKNLNPNQILAVEGVIDCQDLYLIQGPPGTGKTTVIAEICYQNAIRNKKTLIASQTNLAVDNALSKLVHHPKIRALRKGNEESVQAEGVLFTEDNVIGTWLNKTAIDCSILLTKKESELNIAKKTEKNLENIVNEYSKYITIMNEQENYSIKISSLEKQMDELSLKLIWLKENYLDFIKNIKGNSNLNINQNNDASIDTFKNMVNIIYLKYIEQENLTFKLQKEINTITNKIYELNEKIQFIDKIFNKLNKNGKYTQKESKIYSNDISFFNWGNEAKFLENNLDSLNSKKPFLILIYLGLPKEWLSSAAFLLVNFKQFMTCTEAKIIDINERLKVVLSDDPITSMLIDLDQIYIRLFDKWKLDKDLLSEKKNNIELAFIENNKEIIRTYDIIKKFNLKLPYEAEVEEIDEICLKENITEYYTNLWKRNKENDIKYIQFIRSWIQRIEERNEDDYKSLKEVYIKNANVIGITCSQSGSKEFTNLYPTFDVAIIDEVSKATPPELILAILKAKKIVLVGDHKQLPPMIGMDTYEEVAKQLDISNDSTEHMRVSLFEELYSIAQDNIKTMLSTQYRMHNQIMDLINQFYIDEKTSGLVCGINDPDIIRQHNCHGIAIAKENHVIWVDIPLDINNYEKQNHNSYSFSNPVEVECIKNILLTISSNLYKNHKNVIKKIGIISFYSDQVRLLEEKLFDKDFSNKVSNLSLRIGSVDKFQGIECPIIISSFVRNNNRGEIGFAKDFRRINVAMSRAQELSIIVGCKELFCDKNKNSGATKIYNTIACIISESGGIRNVTDFL